MKRKILAVLLSIGLGVALTPVAGCSTAQFDTVLNEVGPAVGDVLALLSAFGVDPKVSVTKIDQDTAGLEKLYSDYESAKTASAQASAEADLNAAFATLNSDLSTVFGIAQVSNANTQKEITIAVSSVGALVAIAEGIIAPSVNGAGFGLLYQKALKAQAGSNPSVSALVSQFNAAVDAAKASDSRCAKVKLHHIHNHNFLVRLVIAGKAK